ncbi:hypothetical protein BOTBODRAFT_181432 [Botryobasidium botryosum FD-172 SS1]|uniref:Uncharacterized protein n=1 Tax=Botryobasidium botryosum (strain FD-172 SS1) TaxID=930990 RepID=A0A067LWD7_BOTB1|nr:hypothetical protein BOTBODRAFT_181432 [Botryobasidium botryosum FD-172 SS1]
MSNVHPIFLRPAQRTRSPADPTGLLRRHKNTTFSGPYNLQIFAIYPPLFYPGYTATSILTIIAATEPYHAASSQGALDTTITPQMESPRLTPCSGRHPMDTIAKKVEQLEDRLPVASKPRCSNDESPYRQQAQMLERRCHPGTRCHLTTLRDTSTKMPRYQQGPPSDGVAGRQQGPKLER